MNEYEVFVEQSWQGKNKILGKKPVQMLLYPPQIPYGWLNLTAYSERLVTNRPIHGTENLFSSHAQLYHKTIRNTQLKIDSLHRKSATQNSSTV